MLGVWRVPGTACCSRRAEGGARHSSAGTEAFRMGFGRTETQALPARPGPRVSGEYRWGGGGGRLYRG